jgi:hypothetical protein
LRESDILHIEECDISDLFGFEGLVIGFWEDDILVDLKYTACFMSDLPDYLLSEME